jgi:hypothetical protein
MKRVHVTSEEVYSSVDYQEYLLVVDEEMAFAMAELDIVFRKQFEAGLIEEPEEIPFRDWYRQYLESPEWKARAEAAKARFGGLCALCSSPDGLEAHHRTYARVGKENPEDLTALCSSCHRAYHDWRLGVLKRA